MGVPRLILASGSKARAQMLRNVKLTFEIIPANINEAEITHQMISMKKTHAQIALRLAEEKAIKISKEYPDNTVIGSDQILVLDNKIMSKSQKTEEARHKLRELCGKTHTLLSAVCIARQGDVYWGTTEQAKLTMRDFNDAFLNDYIESAGQDLLDCVGGYALEGHGAWLFEKVEGDYFTILGMPLLPLLSALKDIGFRP